MSLSTTSFRSKRNQLLLVIAVIFTGFYSFSQVENLSHQSQIIEAIGSDKFNQCLESNLGYLNFLDVRCAKGFAIWDMPAEKTANFQNIISVTTRKMKIVTKDENSFEEMVEEQVSVEELIQQYDSGEFNILTYSLNYHKSEMTYYKLGDTGKVLVLFPTDFISGKSTVN